MRLYDYKPTGRIYSVSDPVQFLLAKVQVQENKENAKEIMANAIKTAEKTQTLVKSKFNLLNPKESRNVDGAGMYGVMNPETSGMITQKPCFRFNR